MSVGAAEKAEPPQLKVKARGVTAEDKKRVAPAITKKKADESRLARLKESGSMPAGAAKKVAPNAKKAVGAFNRKEVRVAK